MSASIINTNNKIKLVLPHGRGFLIVPLDRVLYFSSDNIYCKLHGVDGSTKNILASIKELEMTLCAKHLIRIHKQYIVNLDEINSYSKVEGGFVAIRDIQLPVSRLRRKAFLERLIEDI